MTNRPEAGKAGSTHVSFVCQRCRQPLKIDYTFKSMDASLYKELREPLISKDTDTLTIPSKQEVQPIQEHEDIIRRTIPAAETFSDMESSDFTLIGEMTNVGENISHRSKVIGYLFDIMSGQSEVDHPLCQECGDTLLDLQDQQLQLTEAESKDYRDYYDRIVKAAKSIDEAALQEELEQLKAEEATLREQLASKQREQQEIQACVLKRNEELRQLEEDEERFWIEYNEYARQAFELDEEHRSAENQLRYAQTQLDKLKKTNVFNATFHIWHSGQFGTINNFRLGRLPSVPVEWNEINAAWGQTVLLLHSLARKMNLTFERYHLVPYGNHSYIESLADKSKDLPLYCSGGFRFFWDSKFDQAMVAFLDCLQQFKVAVESGDSAFCLPYRMDKGKIEDSSTGNSYSIKIQFNSEEQWTKALKFMLTNLKWGLAWVSSQFANK